MRLPTRIAAAAILTLLMLTAWALIVGAVVRAS